ncbi:hypothetical protein L596_004637 [Steinernema carpocapsae]|uniref:Secreted protein n=1 Tax=Steinernema carpocapsae TaxID=34508 RepID=A0A4U8UXX7_STECR|nr:hypothetical protein L596_004637 [Steinernema carpocapsae]
MRLLVAALLSCCFITISISSSNMAVALICMTSCPIHGYGGELEWESDQVCSTSLLISAAQPKYTHNQMTLSLLETEE